MKSSLELIVENDLPEDPDRPILMPPGTYDFIMVKYWKGFMCGKAAKLTLVFSVVSEGEYYGYNLYRCYNLKGFTKRKEIIPSGWHSDLIREYSVLFGRPNKLRDIRVSNYQGKVIRGTVRTVIKDYKQRPLHENLQYSIIGELTNVITGQ